MSDRDKVERLHTVKMMTRSVSQVKTFNSCGYRYQLEKVDRKMGKPAAWFPMGTAVHEAAEFWNKGDRSSSADEAVEWFLTAYDRETDKLLEEFPNTSWWFASGPYKGPEDIERRRRVGQDHIRSYIAYYLAHPEERVWITPNGELALELHFEVEFGGVKVQGYIDTVYTVDGEVFVEDTKTGAKPDPAFQLAVYKLALEQEYPGLEVAGGRYFMTAKGKPTSQYDLSEWTLEKMSDTFREMDEKVKALQFEPNPGEACARCGVAWACKFGDNS